MKTKNLNNKKNIYDVLPVVPSLLMMILFIGILFIGKEKLGDEFSGVFSWWWTMLIMGIVSLPLSNLLFSNFSDGGWVFAKVLGFLTSGWLMFVLSSMKIAKFTRTGCIVAVCIVAALNYGLFYYFKKKKTEWLSYVTEKNNCLLSKRILLSMIIEIVFLMLLLIGAFYKCFNPGAYGEEKMMDYGFMASMMRTEYFPVEDMWSAGSNLNYYYFGQYMATFITKLSGTSVNIGYNISLLAIMALCFTLSACISFEIMSRMMITFRNKRKEEGKNVSDVVMEIIPMISAALSGAAVTFAGNMHYTIFSKIIPNLQDMLGIERTGYFYPNSTRYVGFVPATNDMTIHEFPSYSFVLGDLHAHVTDIPFVLTLIAVLFSWIMKRKEKMENAKQGHVLSKTELLYEVFDPSVVMVGFLIGIFMMGNFWDFPIYYVVAGAVILFSNMILCRFKKLAASLTVFHGALVLGVAVLTSLMFSIHFTSMTRGIALAKNHTAVYQFLILWGLPLLVLILYMVSLIKEHKESMNKDDSLKKPEGRLHLTHFMDSISTEDLFLLTIALCAAGLAFMPEVVYVRDIYEASYARSNTMFKLTYQAFIMFGIFMGTSITKLIFLGQKKWQITWGFITAFLLIGTFGYIGNACDSRFGDVNDMTRFKGLDAEAFVNDDVWDGAYSEFVNGRFDHEAILWINENIKGRPVMLEAWGLSYSFCNRISVFTGLPTVEGWETHEWLWHDGAGGYERVMARNTDVDTIYLSEDIDEVRALLEKYNVEYIYLGEKEYKRYDVDEALLSSLGEIVYTNDYSKIIKVK